MPLETIHILLSAGTLLVVGLIAYMGLKVKLDVSEGKSEIIQSITKVSGTLDTHVATDDLKHAQFDRHFEATDSRVTRLEHGRGSRN